LELSYYLEEKCFVISYKIKKEELLK